MPTPAVLFAGILFGLIGLAAFQFGRKNTLYRPMAIGVVLMVFPYAVDQTWLVYLIGSVLCALLYFWRD